MTELARGELNHRWPQVLPGGKAVLFTAGRALNGFDDATIDVMSLTDHRRKTLQRGAAFARYLETSKGAGHLVYLNRGTLFAVAFDPEKLELRGAPTAVLQDVAYSAGTGSGRFDFSPKNGTLVYRSASGVLGGELFPHLSTNDQLLVFSTTDVWVYELHGGQIGRRTFDGRNEAPIWSPDGRFIVFRKPGEGIYWTRSNGEADPQALLKGKDGQAPFSFTPDGKTLAFQQQDGAKGWDLWTVPVEYDDGGAAGRQARAFSCRNSPTSESRPSLPMGTG